MKKLIVFVSVVFLIFCLAFKKANFNYSGASLYGKWEFSEALIDPGDGSGRWKKTPGTLKQYLQIYRNGKIGGNYFSNPTSYKIKGKNTIAIVSDHKKIQNYYYKIEKQTLIISPTYPQVCKEGCSYKFVKVE